MLRDQVADTVFMVRPAIFMANPDTLEDNYFQKTAIEAGEANVRAQSEFDGMVKLLEAAGVRVIQIQDTPEPKTPDSIFPNNWFVTNSDGTMTIFPMYANNRKLESRKPVLYNAAIRAFNPEVILDLRDRGEKHGGALESTGAMAIDRTNGIIYGCRSKRLSEELFNFFCEQRGYVPVLFDAFDRYGMPIYHTNVMMTLGPDIAVICGEAIVADQRDEIFARLRDTGHEIIDITLDQVYSFAGNMLFLKNNMNLPIVVMSESARRSLTEDQLGQLGRYTIVSPNIETIEMLGGGSARCMMAEIFQHN